MLARELPTLAEAMSLWTFGRETPIDGDAWAWRLDIERAAARAARAILNRPRGSG